MKSHDIETAARLLRDRDELYRAAKDIGTASPRVDWHSPALPSGIREKLPELCKEAVAGAITKRIAEAETRLRKLGVELTDAPPATREATLQVAGGGGMAARHIDDQAKALADATARADAAEKAAAEATRRLATEVRRSPGRMAVGVVEELPHG